jgi:hypothetical protein
MVNESWVLVSIVHSGERKVHLQPVLRSESILLAPAVVVHQVFQR